MSVSQKLLVFQVIVSLFGGFGCAHRKDSIAAATLHKTELTRPPMNRAFLASEPYPRLLVEIDYDAGDPPSEHAVGVLRRWLRNHTDKPAGIVVEVDDAIDHEAFGTDRASLVRVASENADGPPDDETYYVYVLYSTRYEKYRGIAWRAGGLSGELPFPVVVMLNKQLRLNSWLWLTRRKVEAAVLVHEMGHVAGLVGAADHTDGTRHCTNPGCRMYRTVDFRSIMANAVPVLCMGLMPTEFCEQCERDLAAGRDPDTWPE